MKKGKKVKAFTDTIQRDHNCCPILGNQQMGLRYIQRYNAGEFPGCKETMNLQMVGVL